MKKLALVIALFLGTTNLNAQDYDLQSLAKTLNQLFPYEVNQGNDFFDFHEGLAKIEVYAQDKRKYGFLDKFGRLAVPAIYESAYDFSEGLAYVELNGKWGFIDKTGRTAIPFVYEYASSGNSFHNNLAAIRKNGKYGVIDKSGNVVVPFIWEFLDNYSDGLIFANRINKGKGEHCFINQSGDIVIPFGRFESSTGFSEGIAIAKTQGYYDNRGNYQRGKDVYIDKTGEILFPSTSGSYIGFSEGLCQQRQGKKYGFINKKGQFVISPIYDSVGDFHEGIAFVEKDGKWGAIDKSGKMAVPFNYDGAEDCSEGLMKVRKDDYWGFVDKTGQVVIPIKYEYVGNFSDGLTQVIYENRFGYMDKKGNTTFDPPVSDKITHVIDSEVVDVTETLPSFVGGQDAMFRWLSEHIQYPEEAFKNGIKGRVVATFYVERDGSVTNIEIIRSVHPLLDNETIRVLGAMPKWIPGTQNGEPVRVKYTVPLTYNFTEE